MGILKSDFKSCELDQINEWIIVTAIITWDKQFKKKWTY